VTEPLARQVSATGSDPAEVARSLVERLAGPELRVAFVFADCRLDPAPLVSGLRALPAPVVGCTALRVIGVAKPPSDEPTAVALGLYGDWLRVGIGVAPELSKAALTRGRDAVYQAASGLGLTADSLDPGRHVAVTLVDGRCNHEEAFCISSAAAAPQIRFVGGGASSPLDREPRTYVWANGVVMSDAAVVVVLDSDQPFHAVTSSHLERTELKTVVTAATGRVIDELDGRPAAARLRTLLALSGEPLAEPISALPALPTFARYVDGVPYVRSLHRIIGNRLLVASAVETGQILYVMRPGDLTHVMKRDLGIAAERVGGTMAAFLAFSCIGRHSEAAMRGSKREMAATFAAYPTVGFQSLSEQSGMLLVNHTLTGLAIGASKP
jgi:hypothetical protein